MKHIWILLKKDMYLLSMSREGLVSMATLVVMNSIVLSFGTTSALLPTQYTIRILPGLLLVSFLFSLFSFVEHGCALDYRDGAIDNLRISGVSPYSIFIAKVIAVTIFSTLTAILSGLIIGILLNISLFIVWGQLLICAILLAFGFSSLLVLLATMVINSKLQGVILPLLAIPMSFPLILAGIELPMEALVGSGIWSSSWLTIILIADVLYFVAGCNLYDFAVKS